MIDVPFRVVDLQERPGGFDTLCLSLPESAQIHVRLKHPSGYRLGDEGILSDGIIPARRKG
jgi:hypothetical protein